MLELIKYKLEELEKLSSSLSADIVKNNDIDNSLKIDINMQFAIIQDSITDINKKLNRYCYWHYATSGAKAGMLPQTPN